MIVLPLIRSLGWDVTDTSHFIYDQKIRDKKVDYVLETNGNKLFIESKGLVEDLADYDTLIKEEQHILDFGDTGDFDYGVLTNGDIWRFYLIKTRDSYEVKISDSKSITEITKYLKKFLSKEKVSTGAHVKYLKGMV